MSAEQIRELNDAFRSRLPPGQVLLTRSVAALSPEVQAEALRTVATFTAFTPENDPYSEHDFGSFTLAGHTFFFKIDYYDADLRGHSPDPADPDVTRRILTIMLAEDY